ncbi:MULTISPECIES: primosomal protein DnaI [Streptococcus]|uniref:Primosomal protein DnaI n=1 Tax=Streptococcus caledonicus TaxID=2614158 RepID=A0ABW0UDY8_9STRE|nr:primosomal protein DnaI [Streptococcus sp. S784/96/1]
MEKVGQTIERSQHLYKTSTDELMRMILADSEISDFIAKNQMTSEQIKRSLPKFNQYRNERAKFQSGDVSYIAKGYQPMLFMNEGYADVSYRETEELKAAQNQQAIENRINLVNLPKTYKKITFQDVYLDDVKRIEVFDDLIRFVAEYPNSQQRGLYLHGDMGVGKSFMLAAMARELAEKKDVSTTFLHFPSFAIDIKNAINTGTVKEEIDLVKKAQVLILDDIGAEQSTSWVRDEVLQVILQYRMLEELPTFFTSNYSFFDLEKKLGNIKGSDETWQAKRVMERIRFLAREIHLQGENRR